MCGICGYTSFNSKVNDSDIILDMNSSLNKRGPDLQDIYIDENTALGHSRLSIIDLTTGNQPMKKVVNNNEYCIVYNGELYNYINLKLSLEKKGYSFFSSSDTEVILVAFIEYGIDCVKYLNGIFSFCIYSKNSNSLFLCRDHLGIKPLFYTLIDNNKTLIFASEIKALLKYPSVTPILDKQGVLELFGLGPAHSPGVTYFKNIFELKAGHFAFFNKDGFDITKYWDLETIECNDSEEEAIYTVKELVTNSTKSQLISDVGISSMLSGGIDSSILTTVANKYIDELNTFSIDFTDNDKFFKANDYQGSQDNEYIKIMNEFLNTKHTNIKFSNDSLFYNLKESMIARDMPGMADIDSSMLAFCKSISSFDVKVCLSGECSDEIFGGYPWFYKDHLKDSNTFPWALSGKIRASMLKKNLVKNTDILDYIDFRYNETLNDVDTSIDDEYNKKFRQINYLTVKWFMNTLVERSDRMSMANSLEVRVPFADHNIFTYVYNLPAKLKLGLTDKNKANIPIEKYLLRKAFENDLPNEIIWRKKSPFPKTYSPIYLELVESEILKILKNPKSKILDLIDKDYVLNLIDLKGTNLSENWFGQLMTYPQTLAFLIQVEYWLDSYNVKIEI